MKIQRRILILLLLLTAIFLTACTDDMPNSNTNTAKSNSTNTNDATGSFTIASTYDPANANIANTNPNNTATNSVAPPPVAAGNTPSSVILNYYLALQKTDENALRKTQSAEAIREWEVEMKASGYKTIVETILDYENLPSKPYEIKSEKIEGDTAILETVNPDTKQTFKEKLVRENNEWKIVALSELGRINLTPQPKADAK